MSAEEWRPVTMAEPGYEVSNLGRVRSFRKHRGDAGPRIMRSHVGSDGYLILGLTSSGKTHNIRVHVLVATAFYGLRPEGAEVRHLDGNPLNNHSTNLAWGTRSENVLDAVAHGTHGMVRRTHCLNGHLLSKHKQGQVRPQRFCRECHNLRAKKPEYAARNRSVYRQNNPTNFAIRAWAEENGLKVNQYGPLTNQVRAAYYAAHQDAVA